MIHIQQIASRVTARAPLRREVDREDCRQAVAVHLLECESVIMEANDPPAYAHEIARNRALKFAVALERRRRWEAGDGSDMDSMSGDDPAVIRIW